MTRGSRTSRRGAARSPTSILWRRLDTPGHDACRLEEGRGGWLVHGTAVFRHETGPARLDYQLACDKAWRSRRGLVRGWVGPARVARTVERSPRGRWTLDGKPVPALDDCEDLDLGFTPATNYTQLRRIALGVGEAADIPVAWLESPTGELKLLPQRYVRRTVDAYWYEAPTVGYEGRLEVGADGFIHSYPGLWEADE